MQGQLRETQRDDFRFLKRRPDMHVAILVVVFLQADINQPILDVPSMPEFRVGERWDRKPFGQLS